MRLSYSIVLFLVALPLFDCWKARTGKGVILSGRPTLVRQRDAGFSAAVAPTRGWGTMSWRVAPLMATTRHSGGGGATKLDRKTAQETITKPTYKEEIEKDWRLILHDDTVHTIQQVCDIVAQICPLCPGPRAYEVTLQVHMTGAGTVAVANKKIITEYTKKLQAAGLTVSMAPDEEFKRGDDEESDENG